VVASGWEKVAVDKPMPLTAVVPIERGRVLTIGQEGVRMLPLAAAH
jgi:hypothetical protein